MNKVGVDLNTASASLLEYISGISKTIAKNIVAYREENGRFETRAQLLKVAKLGPKAYEQCAGFLRILDGKNHALIVPRLKRLFVLIFFLQTLFLSDYSP